jgi:hypothetical protein
MFEYMKIHKEPTFPEIRDTISINAHAKSPFQQLFPLSRPNRHPSSSSLVLLRLFRYFWILSLPYILVLAKSNVGLQLGGIPAALMTRQC